MTNLGAMQERQIPGNSEWCEFVPTRPTRRAYLGLFTGPFWSAIDVVTWFLFFLNRKDLNLYLVGSASTWLAAPGPSSLLASTSSIRAFETSNSSRFSRRSAKLQYHHHLKMLPCLRFAHSSCDSQTRQVAGTYGDDWLDMVNCCFPS